MNREETEQYIAKLQKMIFKYYTDACRAAEPIIGNTTDHFVVPKYSTISLDMEINRPVDVSSSMVTEEYRLVEVKRYKWVKES